MYLLSEYPTVAVLEFDTARLGVVRRHEIGALIRNEGAEAIAVWNSSAAFPSAANQTTLFVGTAIGKVYELRMPPLPTIVNGSVVPPVLQQQAETSNFTAEPTPSVVRVWGEAVRASVGGDVSDRKIGAMQILTLRRTGRAALVALVSGAALLRVFDIESGALLVEHRLPGGALQFEGVHLVPRAARGIDQFDAVLARDEPPALFQVPFSLSAGFDDCLTSESLI